MRHFLAAVPGRRWLAALCAATLAVLGFGGGEASGALTVRVSDRPYAIDPAVSQSGRYIAYATSNVWLRDMVSRRTRLVSVSSSERRGNWFSYAPVMTPDARYVAFCSWASNFAPGDRLVQTPEMTGMNRYLDVFRRDRRTGTTVRVSIGRNGAQPNERSCDPDNWDDDSPAISASGRFVAFASQASNLVRRDTNRARDIFVRDLVERTTQRVSINSSERQANSDSQNVAISASGRFVAFCSSARNLVRGDTNGSSDVFVRDRRTGTTRRVSVDARGRQRAGDCFDPPALSADGRFVTFVTYADLTGPTDQPFGQLFIKDRRTGRVTLVTPGLDGNGADNHISDPSLSASGRWLAWTSRADNIVSGDTTANSDDAFVWDRMTGSTRLVSVRSDGSQVYGFTDRASLSGDGRFVAWSSNGPFTPQDTNGLQDVFRRGPFH